jgi:MazG family protein
MILLFIVKPDLNYKIIIGKTFMTDRPALTVTPPSSSPEAERALRRLVDIMACLRNPDGGCEWDLKQTHETIAPYTIEEAYEVAEAVLSGTSDDLRDELGDLLLQVVFQARIAEEGSRFDLADIADSISEKMLRRHPHIFSETSPRSAAEQRRAWEDMKAEERRAKDKSGVLDDVATTLPPMTRAAKLQKRAARVGFDWERPEDVSGKISEELDEVTQAVRNNSKAEILSEIGDLLFSVVNLARKLDIDPDAALRQANLKFTTRFTYIEKQAEASGQDLNRVTPEQMEIWWGEAKEHSQ